MHLHTAPLGGDFAIAQYCQVHLQQWTPSVSHSGLSHTHTVEVTIDTDCWHSTIKYVSHRSQWLASGTILQVPFWASRDIRTYVHSIKGGPHWWSCQWIYVHTAYNVYSYRLWPDDVTPWPDDVRPWVDYIRPWCKNIRWWLDDA